MCKTLMENTSSFILMTQAFVHKCVVKYLRILFLYSEHTNTQQIHCFIFLHKDNVHSVDPSQHRAAHMLVYIQKIIYCTQLQEKNKTKQTVQRPLLCLSRATATHPHHEPCFPGQAAAYWVQPWKAPTAIDPHASSTAWRRGICVCVFVIHFPSPDRKLFLSRIRGIEEWRIWREINN